MAVDTTPTTIAEDEAIALLEPWQETVDPCAKGHVEHGPDAHLGRRIVHSISPRGFGADWDYEAVVEFIRRSDRRHLITGRGAGHSLAVHAEDRWMAFETRADIERDRHGR